MSTNQNLKLHWLKVIALAGIITAVSMLLITCDPFQISETSEISVPTKNQSEQKHFQNSYAVTEPEIITRSIPVITAPPNVKPQKVLLASVIPPLEKLRPAPYEKIVNPDEGGSIECESGSVVHIPRNAFVDEHGKPVKENVKLKFNEYNDYKEIFFSGIPMVYSVNGKDNQFESAGMMQLEASASDKPVYMSPGSKIKVLLASAERSKDYNLYYFDKDKGNWVEKGKDQVTYKKKPVIRRENKITYESYKSKHREVHVRSFDGVPEDKVFLWWKSPATEFDFSFTTLSKSFPELKTLATTRWEYKGADAKEIYSKMFNIPQRDKNVIANRGEWNSYTVSFDKEKVLASFVFKKDDETLAIVVRPKDKSEKNTFKVRERMEKYEEAMIKRKKEDIVRYEKFQQDSTIFMAREAPDDEVSLAVMRSFEIDDLGIWNVDKIANISNFVAFNLQFVDENNNPIKIDVVYLADKAFNSVFQYKTPSISNVFLNPFSNNMLWAVLPGNRLAIAGQDQLWKLTGTKGKQKVVMKIKEDAVASIEDAREELNF